MLADSGSGGALTGATLSAYEREPNPTVARRCTQHRCEIARWTRAATGGARDSRLAKCARMEASTPGSVITANTLTDHAQRGHTLTSMSSTRRRRCIHVIAVRERAALGSSSAPVARTWPFAMTGARWRALAVTLSDDVREKAQQFLID
jgi:hypothetical protein